MATFIKATEYWLPNADRSLLEFGGGLYAPGSRMAHVSPDMCFGRGEGLPGRAWEDGRPVVLQRFEASYFKRTAAAAADGLSCGIAVPFFMGDYIAAVVVFFCGDDDSHVGAIEVWHNDPALGKDMVLADGHYGRTGDTFEYLSRRTSFRQGIGLPGRVWESGEPLFLPDLGRGSGFLRGEGAVKVGINRGLAVPCATPGPGAWVLAFLSALGTPIARRVEIWKPEGDALALEAGFCEVQGELGPGPLRLAPGQGLVGRCRAMGLPVLREGLEGEPGEAASIAGLAAMVVLPVLRQARFAAAVALYF